MAGEKGATFPGGLVFSGGTWREFVRGVLWRELARATTFKEPARGITWRVNEGSSDMLDTLVMRDGETATYTWDLSRLPEIASGGLTVLSATARPVELVSGTGALPTVSNVAVGSDNKSVTATVTGGVTGCVYLMRCLATLTGGVIVKQGNGLLQITDG